MMSVGNNLGPGGVMGRAPGTKYGVAVAPAHYNKGFGKEYRGNIDAKNSFSFTPRMYTKWGWHA
jgi:hypothetical protein